MSQDSKRLARVLRELKDRVLALADAAQDLPKFVDYIERAFERLLEEQPRRVL